MIWRPSQDSKTTSHGDTLHGATPFDKKSSGNWFLRCYLIEIGIMSLILTLFFG